ncbi:hypothetical protein C8E95_2805 [Pseudonocardia autotrophica]|uniref:Uncharacterized protein n=1 Tax=Pseudonocardia autotrophica TaxID=2074 RepID=A0A1Y2MRJ4_PSEAH|nr:hypothetical protein BG845_04616 [Pseudonocardia autotrophica]TDN73701.1 hypothetical protein C8E95_2805 [Pseudonocardia autotrophica]
MSKYTSTVPSPSVLLSNSRTVIPGDASSAPGSSASSRDSGSPSVFARAYSVDRVGLRVPFSISDSDPLPMPARVASAPTESRWARRAARTRSPTAIRRVSVSTRPL